MQIIDQHFNVQDLFDSLSPEEQDRINCSISNNTRSREVERFERLQAAEIAKNKLVQELDLIECEIADNNNWFITAKEHKAFVTNDALNQHRMIAKELYSRKRRTIDSLLPKAESSIKTVISQIEDEEAQESLFKKKDLQSLLLPFYEKRERERVDAIVAQAKERIRKREQKEASRQEEYEALLNRLSAEELERSRIFTTEQRKERTDYIRTQVETKKISHLVHFTPIANVESILENGLRSRNALAGHQYVFTDDYRTDGWLDWISLSVSFPNYKMFYAKKNSLKKIDGWAILLIKKEVLWELDCKFILTNAASYGIRMFRDDTWSSVKAFEDMFNYVEHRSGIPDCFTTDPQAEVMIKNEVSSNYIDLIAVERRHDLKRLGKLQDIKVETIPELFKWRSDFEHWRKFHLSPFSSDSKLVTPF